MFSGLRGAQGVHKERSHKGTRVDSGLAYPEKPQHLGENTSRACYVRTLLLRIRSYFIYLLPSYEEVHILLNICVSVFFFGTAARGALQVPNNVDCSVQLKTYHRSLALFTSH